MNSIRQIDEHSYRIYGAFEQSIDDLKAALRAVKKQQQRDEQLLQEFYQSFRAKVANGSISQDKSLPMDIEEKHLNLLEIGDVIWLLKKDIK